MVHPNPLPAGRPNEPVDLADDLRMYRLVRRIRSFEESLVTLFGEGKVYGTAHTCIGQEAVAVGALFDLTEDDFVTGTHSKPRALHRQGRGRRGDDGGAPRPRDRLLRRQGRLDAHRGPRPQHAGGATAW